MPSPERIQEAKDFPLSIDTIVTPLFNGCKNYAKGIIKAKSSPKAEESAKFRE